jgi:hypothetical protein
MRTKTLIVLRYKSIGFEEEKMKQASIQVPHIV